MQDRAWLESTWKQISHGVHVDKVYIETYRIVAKVTPIPGT